jgi:hypothetical protein
LGRRRGGAAGAGGALGKVRKSLLFLKKKKQKDFSPLMSWRAFPVGAHAKEQKIFASFFQKRRPSFPPRPSATQTSHHSDCYSP